MLKSRQELQSTCTSSCFRHHTDLPKSETSSSSAPSAALGVGVMLQREFQVLPGTNHPLQLPPLHTQPEVSTSGAAAGNNSLKFFLRKNSGEKSKNYGAYPNVVGNHPTFNLQNTGFSYNSTNVSSCTSSVLQAPPDFWVTLHENSSTKVVLHPNLSHAAGASFKALTFTLIYIYTDL